MVRLATCLCSVLTEAGRPTCFCGVIPGDAPVASYSGECSNGDCGMAWVRLTTAYMANGVGQTADLTPGNCSKELGVDLEIGVLRCIDVEVESPPAAELLAQTEVQTKDAEAIIRALACCDAISSKDFILGGYTPMGPMGGYLGGMWQVRMIAVP